MCSCACAVIIEGLEPKPQVSTQPEQYKKYEPCRVCIGFPHLFLLLFKYIIVPCEKPGLPYLGKAQQLQEQCCPFLSVCARAVLPISVSVCKSSAAHFCQCVQEQCCPFLSVCAIFLCIQTMVRLQFWGFLMCTQTLIHAIVHGGCTDTVREVALEVNSGENLFATLGTQTCVSVAPGFLVGHSLN